MAGECGAGIFPPSRRQNTIRTALRPESAVFRSLPPLVQRAREQLTRGKRGFYVCTCAWGKRTRRMAREMDGAGPGALGCRGYDAFGPFSLPGDTGRETTRRTRPQSGQGIHSRHCEPGRAPRPIRPGTAHLAHAKKVRRRTATDPFGMLFRIRCSHWARAWAAFFRPRDGAAFWAVFRLPAPVWAFPCPARISR